MPRAAPSTCSVLSPYIYSSARTEYIVPAALKCLAEAKFTTAGAPRVGLFGQAVLRALYQSIRSGKPAFFDVPGMFLEQTAG